MSTLNTKVKTPPIYLDLTHLQQISEGDTAFECEILLIYLREVPEIVRQTQQALKGRDYLEAANLIHVLKSKIRVVGLKQAWRLADFIEINLRKKTNLNQLGSKIEIFFKIIRKSIFLVNKELLKSTK
ncbi:MAG: Hpt domain-containing protein [Chitinophagales bacterium]